MSYSLVVHKYINNSLSLCVSLSYGLCSLSLSLSLCSLLGLEFWSHLFHFDFLMKCFAPRKRGILCLWTNKYTLWLSAVPNVLWSVGKCLGLTDFCIFWWQLLLLLRTRSGVFDPIFLLFLKRWWICCSMWSVAYFYIVPWSSQCGWSKWTRGDSQKWHLIWYI